jgi:alpha-glucosidase (family GH31 glycosyl hydrolase)
MNPLWSFGFHQSRERYASAEELAGTVRKYRELGVPLDGIIQDWQYWGDHAHWNAVQFLNPQFPDPAGMMAEIHGLHAHALISVWPSFGPETDIRKELEAENLLLPISTFPQDNGVRVYDPWNPRARDIYWSYMERNLWDAGLDGWWLDATEPEHSPVEASDYDYPSPEGSFRLSSPAIANPASTHGTGCSLSAAIAAALATGLALPEAVAAGKAYVYESIRTSLPVGPAATVLGMPDPALLRNHPDVRVERA